METLKATGGEAEFFGRWSGYQAKTLIGEQRLALLAETTSLVPWMVGGLTTAAIYLLGGLRVMNGEMTIGMLVAYQTLVTSFTEFVRRFGAPFPIVNGTPRICLAKLTR
jgi:ABC-type bacteriocin/lantibiotic exporter with double-glycine peptidase domain